MHNYRQLGNEYLVILHMNTKQKILIGIGGIVTLGLLTTGGYMAYKHFTIKEFTASQKAREKGIDNTLPPHLEPNAHRTLSTLDTIRHHFGRPITINSGYRSTALNFAVNGSKTSVHPSALAVDITSNDNPRLYTLIQTLAKQGLITYDQNIWEYGGRWIHLGIALPNGTQRTQNISIG